MLPAFDPLACHAVGWQATPVVWLRLVVLLAMVALMLWVSAHRWFAGRQGFLGLHGVMAGWLFINAMEHAASTYECRVTLSLLAWPLILLLPVLWLAFIAQYTGSRSRIASRRQALLFGLPTALLSLAALFNGSLGLFYAAGTQPGALLYGAPLLAITRGPFYYVAIVWGYALMLAAFVIVVRAMVNSEPGLRSHWVAFLLVGLAPWLSNIAYVGFGWRLLGADPTPVSFAVSVAGFAWLMHTRRLFDVVPLARGLLFRELPDQVLVLDVGGRVMEANAAARQVAGGAAAIGRPVAEWPRLGPALAERLQDPHAGALISLRDPPAVYELRVRMVGEAARHIGRLVQLHDVTEQQQAQARMAQALAERNAQLNRVAALQDELREQALRDPLTGLHNRRALEQRFAQEAEYHGSTGQPMALVLIDIDHFKRINDLRGHAAGDAVLCDMATMLKAGIRSGDSVFRIGGEEFALLLPGADADHARTRVEALRRTLHLRPPAAARDHVTFSAGVAEFGESGTTLDTMLHAADTALYRAKAGGRDRTELAAA
jgi:diguanylate cyclase (GGDEF)-like protein